jgi:hypothetical protein
MHVSAASSRKDTSRSQSFCIMELPRGWII